MFIRMYFSRLVMIRPTINVCPKFRCKYTQKFNQLKLLTQLIRPSSWILGLVTSSKYKNGSRPCHQSGPSLELLFNLTAYLCTTWSVNGDNDEVGTTNFSAITTPVAWSMNFQVSNFFPWWKSTTNNQQTAWPWHAKKPRDLRKQLTGFLGALLRLILPSSAKQQMIERSWKIRDRATAAFLIISDRVITLFFKGIAQKPMFHAETIDHVVHKPAFWGWRNLYQ